MAKQKATLFEQYTAAKIAPPPSWHHHPLLRWSVIGASIVVCAICMPSISRVLFGPRAIAIPAIGFRWTGKAIVAERSFSILKPPEQYQLECQNARVGASPVYELDKVTELPDTYRNSISQIIAALPDRRSVGSGLIRLLDSIMQNRILIDTLVPTNSRFILVREGERLYRQLPITAAITKRQLEQRLVKFLTSYNLDDTLSVRIAQALSATFPAATYSASRSEQEQELAVKSVRRTYGIVRKGETVVAPGEVITPFVAAKLASYQEMVIADSAALTLPGVLSALVRAAVLCSIVWTYLIFVRTEHFSDNRVAITIASLLSLSALQSLFSSILSAEYAAEFLVLLPAMTMIVTVLYDARLAYAFAMSAALVHIAIRMGDLVSGLGLLTASVAGTIGFQNIQSRYQFARATIFIALGFALTLIISVLENELLLDRIPPPTIAAAINTLLSPLLVYGVLVALDRVFKIPTDLRLLELDTLSHPLLVKMRQIAPGTYQHTLNVANLAEHAAITIGANPLLARVGAYFHDIGKLRKPEYFAENQIELSDKHRELSPRQSAAVIRSHVEEGIELALEYRLPPKVIEFIPAHHGTSLIRHFYAMALDEARNTNTVIDEEDFRYQGPKPRSMETSIVMLADVAEAISRTAETRSEIENRLEEVFREKINDGQLDESPLSLAQIATIRRLFTDLLVGMIHQRPEYKAIELPRN
ncbi:MAG: HDIG domain-containing protein [Candidatus Kapabacteria bacterium]|nr:HDIG domain-containing protein [Candidatus Kapabacteria bacterium]MCX7936234.1 HDIG domain-containing protein [Chlorobiota bacterium]